MNNLRFRYHQIALSLFFLRAMTAVFTFLDAAFYNLCLLLLIRSLLFYQSNPIAASSPMPFIRSRFPRDFTSARHVFVAYIIRYIIELTFVPLSTRCLCCYKLIIDQYLKIPISRLVSPIGNLQRKVFFLL